jgi:hypothetical protein
MIGLLLKMRRLNSHHTEPLSRRCFHHPPGANLFDALRSQFFKSLYFRLDVVGFNVEMHTTGMFDGLYLDVQVMCIID